MPNIPRTRPTRSASKVGRASGFFAAEVTRVVDGTDVYVQVPRLTLDFEHGPVQYLGSLPTAGDSVWVSFQEGRVDELVMFTASEAGDISAVTAGTNLNGGGLSGAVTLNLDTNITGDITFDTSVLVVDATNNRIGIGTTAPAFPLSVAGHNINLAGYTSIGSTLSGAMSIFGHNVHADPSVNNKVLSTNTGYYGQMIKMYWNEGITFHAVNSTVTAGNAFFTEGGTTNELMRIANDGNVGIGTTTPGYPLEVYRTGGNYENIRIINTAAGALYRSTDSTATTEMGTQAGNAVIRTANTVRLAVTAAGNVGIGTTAPSESLHSTGALRAQSVGADGGMVMGQAYSSSYVGLHTNGMGNSGEAEYVLLSDGTHTFLSSGENGDTYIRAGDNSTTHQLKIGSAAAEFSGYVQTGSNLRVISYNGEGWSEGIRVVVASGSWGGIRFKRTNDTSAEIGNWYMGYQNNSTHDFAFGCYNTGQLDNILYLKNSNGNVGIGTATPVAKLSVTSGSTNSSAHFGKYDDEGLFLHSDAQSSHYNWRITTNTVVDTGFEIAPSTAVGGTTWADPLFVIKQNGSVGIGTTSPAAPLSFANDTGQKIDFYYTTGSGGDRYGIQVQSSELRIHSGALGTSTGGITFGKQTTSAFTENMRITNAGKVGIGTATPLTKLHIVAGGHAEEVARLTGGAWSDLVQGSVFLGFHHHLMTPQVYPSVRIGALETDLSDYDASLVFQTRNSGNDSVPLTRMTITDVGRVGINTTNPISPLNVSVGGTWTHGWSSGHQLTVTRMGGNAGIGLYSSKGSGDTYNQKYGYIRFGNPEINTYAGGIKYTHFSNDMDFRAGGSDFINMQSTGQVVTTVTNTSQTYSSIYAQASHASTTADGIIRIHSARSANSAFEFLRAGTVSDPEFILRGDGNGYADGSWTSPAADYAEYFEWNDGNPSSEDRVGITVSLIGNKIQAATEGDEIIGVVSANPVIVGDAAWNKWQDKYLVDDYNRYQTETVETVSWVETPLPSEDDEEPSKVTHSYIFDSIPEGVTPPDDAERLDVDRRILNPDYDPDQTYVPREDRPEWDTIGLVGKLRIRKGQPTAAGWIKMRDISDTVEEWLVK